MSVGAGRNTGRRRATRRVRVRRKILIIAVVAGLALLSLPAAAAPPNLYEWLNVAPVVVVAENLGTYGKYTEFRVLSVLRGEQQPEERIRVNVRRANRDRNRNVDKQALRFETGLSYVVLLVPVAVRDPAAPPTFEFVRGVRGAREVPLEGQAAFLGAVERFVRIQERKDDLHTWRELAEMIEETNPVLVETALDMFLKFHRGEDDLLGSLRPLLDHPSNGTRERTAMLIGQIIGRGAPRPVPDAALLQSQLVAKARRDQAVPVRVAATRALDLLPGGNVLLILEEIAREDPDQTVRYTAERLIYDRRQDPARERPEKETD